jgi:hypothetical protein
MRLNKVSANASGKVHRKPDDRPDVSIPSATDLNVCYKLAYV